ncbi:flavin reductase family protein [Paenactinomyces guangxiensis]|uniref:Flavin reductase family protein n=1 Tax=Paenactinomyces guangxiensis TaxID=1490290 RepID=A0A7W1WNF7_9BACL|nr:flavin reductase family protein [Paenactinomyces guangxiensis]MBA4493031.1 flavin reductase family protein [Paenactinomyces guangxiensis]MBH8590120.1 flavin reductase family protein [Paenactinomyces guangxiensis]
MDDRTFRKAMGKFATGITVITTEVENKIHGMTANAFMSVSLSPKLVLVSVSEKAHMHSQLKKAGTYAVSVLGADQQEMSMLFAGQIKGDRDIHFERFNEMPVIKGALAVLTCNKADEHRAGDHTLFIGEVTNLRVSEGEPLLYFQGRYRRLAAAAED